MLKKQLVIKILISCTFVYFNLHFSECKHRLKNKDFGAKIVGGKPAALEKYPYAIQFFNLGALCGGIILNSWSVLTSAHCLDNNKDITEMSVQIGSKYVYDFSAKRYEVEMFSMHEGYNKVIPFENDIAIVFVKEPIKFSALAKKGVLVKHDKWMDPNEKRFIVIGWGWQKYGGVISEMNLMLTFLRYVPFHECSRMHNLTLSDDMFCLYGDGTRDTCRGDSGGGVLWNGYLVGLTSHGDGCAKRDKPSVYTNLWHMKSWIRKQVTQFIRHYCRQWSRLKISRVGKTIKIHRKNII